MPGFNLTYPKDRELTGGDLLAQSLKQLGVEVAFGLHGGHLDAFLMGCTDIGIRLVDTRHETAAVQAAEGYCRVSTKPAVCFVTANTYGDRSPILCITSSPPTRDTENNALQGCIDQIVAARPITKFAHRVVVSEEIPRLVSHAMRMAQSSPPGPVLLDFPIDILFIPVYPKLISWGSIASPPSYPPGAHPKAVAEAARLIRNAKRPAIITSTGARAVRPSSLLPARNPPCCQRRRKVLALLEPAQQPRPDLIILLGARTGMYLGGRSGAIIPNENCQLVQVDCDGGEIGRTLPVDLGIVADTGVFAAALATELGTPSTYRGSVDQQWVQSVLALSSAAPPFEEDPSETETGALHPYHALKHVFSAVEPGSIVVLDGGEASAWASDLAHLSRPSTVITATGYLGFLGNGFGYTLGCAIAAPDRKIVHIQGDGSAGFHMMELDTYRRFNLNVLTIVVNNSCWGMSMNGQDLVYGDGNAARPVSALSPGTEYDTVARGLQNHAAKVSKVSEIQRTVTDLQRKTGPSCIDLLVDRKPVHPMTTAMVGITDDSEAVVVPYYDNIPRAHYKF
ncbi:hypothetical protein N7470_002015 [Penicillium chermesinum]|nr:hypothetical protein N7470_002015 [Penicillium chermesinum]